MKVVNIPVLEVVKQGYPDARGPINAWLAEARTAQWWNPHQVKEKYGSASFPGKSKAIFNVGGNKYRIVTTIAYRTQIVYVEWAGPHSEYSKMRLK